MRARHTFTVTRLRGGKDAFGDPLPGAELDIPGCWWAARRTMTRGTEDNDAENTVIAVKPLVTPPGTDIRPHDQVRVDGAVWDVVGEVSDPVSPFSGWAPGVVVNLRRVTG